MTTQQNGSQIDNLVLFDEMTLSQETLEFIKSKLSLDSKWVATYFVYRMESTERNHKYDSLNVNHVFLETHKFMKMQSIEEYIDSIAGVVAYWINQNVDFNYKFSHFIFTAIFSHNDVQEMKLVLRERGIRMVNEFVRYFGYKDANFKEKICHETM
jgi:hypothetical protein